MSKKSEVIFSGVSTSGRITVRDYGVSPDRYQVSVHGGGEERHEYSESRAEALRRSVEIWQEMQLAGAVPVPQAGK